MTWTSFWKGSLAIVGTVLTGLVLCIPYLGTQITMALWQKSDSMDRAFAGLFLISYTASTWILARILLVSCVGHWLRTKGLGLRFTEPNHLRS
jgi:hypothetical protein